MAALDHIRWRARLIRGQISRFLFLDFHTSHNILYEIITQASYHPMLHYFRLFTNQQYTIFLKKNYYYFFHNIFRARIVIIFQNVVLKMTDVPEGK